MFEMFMFLKGNSHILTAYIEDITTTEDWREAEEDGSIPAS